VVVGLGSAGVRDVEDEAHVVGDRLRGARENLVTPRLEVLRQPTDELVDEGAAVVGSEADLHRMEPRRVMGAIVAPASRLLP
jgi:hypothetical protein